MWLYCLPRWPDDSARARMMYLTVFYVAVRPDHGKREILRYRYCHSGVRAWGLPFSGYHCLGQNDIPVSETGRVRLGLRLIWTTW